MRGSDRVQVSMLSDVSLESRIPADHPLRRMREMVDTALKGPSRRMLPSEHFSVDGSLIKATGRSVRAFGPRTQVGTIRTTIRAT